MTLKEALTCALRGQAMVHPGLDMATLFWSDDFHDFAIDYGDEERAVQGNFFLLPRSDWEVDVEGLKAGGFCERD